MDERIDQAGTPRALTDSIRALTATPFHGPLFQMIRTLDRTGREGIEGTLEVQPRTGWFRSSVRC